MSRPCNYRQIRPLTLYEPPKEANAVTANIDAATREREVRSETEAGERIALGDVLHSRPPDGTGDINRDNKTHHRRNDWCDYAVSRVIRTLLPAIILDS